MARVTEIVYQDMRKTFGDASRCFPSFPPEFIQSFCDQREPSMTRRLIREMTEDLSNKENN